MSHDFGKKFLGCPVSCNDQLNVAEKTTSRAWIHKEKKREVLLMEGQTWNGKKEQLLVIFGCSKIYFPVVVADLGIS